MNPETITVVSGDVTYEFGRDGFLRSCSLSGFNGAEYDIPAGDFGRIRIRLSDGRELVPVCGAEPVRTDGNGKTVLEFPSILWRDGDGGEDLFRLSLRYELLSAGRAFVNAFFCASNMHSPSLDEFSLKFDLAVSQFQKSMWAIVPRPKVIDSSMIQSMRAGRGLKPGDNRRYDACILPDVSVNARSAGGETAYMEVLVEGDNSISLDADDNFTDLKWDEKGDFHLNYSFIRKTPCTNKLMQLWQWRNQWGWIVKTADKTRQKPPLHMYHYFDNFEHFPTDECLESLARCGTDLLILHECWRFDLQNDGVAFDPAALRRVIDGAHKHGIRVALYIRGNEISALDGACEWFDRWLKKDFDGLYMDYGGPFHQSLPEENFPGGRIPFQSYLLRMESLRARIGTEGLFYGHTGTSYSGIWYASGCIDGYVSGEGEGGVMVSSREAHEYYSMAAVSPGTMWTGAFPAYSTAKMRPFLAAAGQYPHSPLGVQFVSSSLAHPREPGLNDAAFRPIWKIWRVFRRERDLAILNDYNSSGVFSPAENAGHYLMVSHDRKRALLVVSNFAETSNSFRCKLNADLCGFSPASMKAWKLVPTETAPGKAEAVDARTLDFEFTLGPLDVGAIYLESDEAAARAELADFETPYPAYSADNLRHLAYLDEQKKLRYSAAPVKTLFMSLTVPNTNLSYEYSLAYDLYYNSMALVEFLPDGSEKTLGWISQKGFVSDEPKPDDYIWPDVVSPRVPLHEILGRGEHFIGIRSVHFGAPFYSFMTVDLSVSEDGSDAKTLYFMNELEPKREYLRWKVTIL